ncbi:Cell division protein FtsI/penicillin-binding protein 2 [Evansella caseinilytica]|uniref:serine-type D-Ala-D-Ala carboxypeptidase n=1 Tax=Evansella caseinilytica TaxID=1503961 RepID=A0A1H3KP57_9BACI|nr:penicillin-binding protein 2 [Evansella caseinilytica]SDY53836.1 Cell division protein FtsI/penicillin-binding protein 2 [Evansella caseinilytica]
MSEKKGKKNHIPVRLNLLFFLVFLLFSALILRLGFVQIVQGEDFEEKLERTINISVPVEAPRGLMYDRFGNVVVDNDLLLTATYTNRYTPQAEMLATARRLNEYITLEPTRVYERDIREYWSLLFPDEYEAKLPLEEAKTLDIGGDDIHKERLDRITEEELERLTDEDMEVFALWREFNVGYNNLPHKIKRGISYEEAALIMENLESLPGVDIIRDSRRKYVYADSLRGVFGNVGSIPKDDIDYFLANGYERNAEVGRSYLESQYETVLSGRKGQLDNFMDQDGNFLKNPEERLGSRGNDLVLTFDMELQQHVEAIIESRVKEFSASFIGEPNAYVVMMEPHTGDVLAMAGYTSDIATFTLGFEMGSAIKGATVLAGFDTGVITPQTTILDRTLNLPGARPISSHRPLGYVNYSSALEMSSNIYMVEIAMRIIGYIPGVSGTNWGNFYRGYDVLRSYYSQFGLGVKTGIDLPNEFTGINGGNSREPGQLLFLSFGQFDTYTPLQLAQYVSTIANDGYRIAPRVVKEIREPGRSREELGPISQQLEPKVLNKLAIDESYIDLVKQGFYQVTHGSRGTATGFFGNAGKPYSDYQVAGKTGTAQVFVDGREANNQTFVAFAPYDAPEVAIAVVVPGINKNQSGVANRISQDILYAYFSLEEQRSGPENREEVSAVEE